MTKRCAMRLAEQAIRSIENEKMTADENLLACPVADTTVVVKTAEGKFSVCDNGEEVSGLNRQGAIRIIVENLTI